MLSSDIDISYDSPNRQNCEAPFFTSVTNIRRAKKGIIVSEIPQIANNFHMICQYSLNLIDRNCIIPIFAVEIELSLLTPEFKDFLYYIQKELWLVEPHVGIKSWNNDLIKMIILQNYYFFMVIYIYIAISNE